MEIFSRYIVLYHGKILHLSTLLIIGDKMVLKRVICILIVFLTGLPAVGFSEETIRLSSEEWPPFTSKVLKYNGVFSRIVKEAFALEGVKVKYGFFPAARSYSVAAKGHWDGSIPWNRTPDREKDFNFSDVVMKGELVFFHLKDFEFDWKSINDLKGLRIGGTLGYNYREAFQNAEKSGMIRVERIHSDLLNFRKLLRKRFHIFPANKSVGYYLLSKSFSPNMIELVTYHPRPLAIDKLRVLFSKNIERNNRMLKLFNKGLKRLKESGKVEQFINESQRGEYIINR